MWLGVWDSCLCSEHSSYFLMVLWELFSGPFFWQVLTARRGIWGVVLSLQLWVSVRGAAMCGCGEHPAVASWDVQLCWECDVSHNNMELACTKPVATRQTCFKNYKIIGETNHLCRILAGRLTCSEWHLMKKMSWLKGDAGPDNGSHLHFGRTWPQKPSSRNSVSRCRANISPENCNSIFYPFLVSSLLNFEQWRKE